MLVIYKDLLDRMNVLDKAEIIKARAEEIYKKDNTITRLKAFNLASKELEICTIPILTKMLESEFTRNGLTDLALDLSREIDKHIVREQKKKLYQFKRSVA